MQPPPSPADTRQGVVQAWFGTHFAQLHPALQALHFHGGQLEGPVQITLGKGLAGWLGTRFARRLGIPFPAPGQRLTVDIHSDADGLHWGRRFAGGHHFDSVFTPVGQFPDGHWIEHSGRMRLALGVTLQDGAWHWQPRRAWLGRWPLPMALMPRMQAHKAVDGKHYRFLVRVCLPLIGMLLSYTGQLQIVPTGAETSA
ncbi:MAG: hypothetical protein RLZZ618_1852 [Pseudomonadota bacterium]